MRRLHHGLDRLDVARRVKKWQKLGSAPIESSVEDLRALSEAEALDALHPHVAAARLTYAEPTAGKKGIEEQAFTFRSPAPSGHRENDMVHGVRWRNPHNSQRRTIVIMLHGGFAENFVAERLFCPRVLAEGVDVACLANAHHMERAPSGSAYSGQFLISGDIPRLIRGFAQGAADARALAAALREEGYERVLVSGISLGGNAALQAAARAPFDGVLAVAPAADPFLTLWTTPIGALVRQEAAAAGFEESVVRRAMGVIAPASLTPPVTDTSRIWIVYGEHDLLAPPEPVEKLLDTWNLRAHNSFRVGHRTLAVKLPVLRRLYGEFATKQWHPLPRA